MLNDASKQQSGIARLGFDLRAAKIELSARNARRIVSGCNIRLTTLFRSANGRL
jgi:hypothetical protein